MSPHDTIHFSAKLEWTKVFWEFIHTITLFSTETYDIQELKHVINGLAHLIPCKECKEHLMHFHEQHNVEEYLQRDRRLGLFEWTVDLHNSVNEKLGRPILPFRQALEIWANVFYAS